MKRIRVKQNEENKRLDIFLSEKLNESRSLISKHIKLGNILVNEEKVKSGYLTKLNDLIQIKSLEENTNVNPEDINLDIYYEDDYLMVINKPSGMVVHPAPGNYEHTLVNALVHYTKNNLSDINGEYRPGIVHRIDAETSGLLVVSKDNKTHEALSKMFKEHKIKRKYFALVSGNLPTMAGKIDAPIGRSEKDRKKMAVTDINSKKAVTNYIVIERYEKANLVELILSTGRTHQIRVHMAYIGHPIINDPVYGKVIVKDYGQMLHAGYLAFTHPVTQEFMEFVSPTEKKFDEILRMFKN